MTRKIYFVLFVLLCANQLQSQTLIQPLDLAKRIFGKQKFAAIKQYSTGDYKKDLAPTGQDLNPRLRKTFHLLAQNNRTAVVSLTLQDSTGDGVDTYLHFKKETVWKITAFRVLAQTGLIDGAIQEMEKIKGAQIDSFIATKSDEKINTRADFDNCLNSFKLTISLDSVIIQHFVKNKTAFEKLKTRALELVKKDSARNESLFTLDKEFEQDSRNLLITGVNSDESFNNGINFVIGGILDNTVGYLFIGNKKNLPEMSPGELIMLKEIGDGWYIFKTT